MEVVITDVTLSFLSSFRHKYLARAVVQDGLLIKVFLQITHSLLYVTGFGKTLRMGFFQKIEFDAWLISSTIELMRVQVLGRSRASLWRYSALFVIAPHPQ